MKFFHIGFKRSRFNWPYADSFSLNRNLLFHCRQCNEKQPWMVHGYCKTWGIWIMGRTLFAFDTKRQYQNFCKKCSTPVRKTTTFRFREINDNRETIGLGLYSAIFILPFITAIPWALLSLGHTSCSILYFILLIFQLTYFHENEREPKSQL